MKRFFSGLSILVFIGLIITPELTSAQNDNGNTGLGLMIGEPTGVNFKYWASERNAFDAGLAWSLGLYDAVHIHGDYLWHNYSVFTDIEEGELPLYYGIGGRIVFAEDDAVIGVRVPVGINYIFEDSPLDLFLEVAPVVNLVPDTDLDVNGGLGIRIYL